LQNISQFGLRSVEDERILDNNAKYEDGSGLQDYKTTAARSEMYAKSSGNSLPHISTHIMLLNLLISITSWTFTMVNTLSVRKHALG
uniref:Ovule protein n=1 Tax=Brugia timori TaxID=42155 RepID=A0A0R3QEG7_9BILA